MLYYWSQYILEQTQGSPWREYLSPLRVFSYITFRTAGAAITALVLSLWMGPKVIEWLKRLKFGQEYDDKMEEAQKKQYREEMQKMKLDGPLKSPFRINKKGTPTMGGILIVPVLDITGLLWAQWNELVLLTLLSVVVLAGLGFYDDYMKITRQNNRGTTSCVKLTVQFLLAGYISVYLWLLPKTASLITDIYVPFYKYPVATGAVVLGLLITIASIVGSSNAVNLTDGLDGLAIGCTLIVTFVFLVLTYLAGNAIFSAYLFIPHVVGAGELTVLCAALIGAGLGFLWFNCHPAQVFMGDTGSLALGGALGIMAVLIHQPFILVIAGGVFVVEALSVVLQTTWFKISRRLYGEGRRIFLMAPLHHHFEMMGWFEPKVVVRFYIMCILCAVMALCTLKIR